MVTAVAETSFFAKNFAIILLIYNILFLSFLFLFFLYRMVFLPPIGLKWLR